jgi:serine/threonine protein kinase
VAVKLVELEELQTALELLIKEAHTMMSLRHPNVLHLHSSFISGETLWLVMPYISGGSLSQVLRSQVSKTPGRLALHSCVRHPRYPSHVQGSLSLILSKPFSEATHLWELTSPLRWLPTSLTCLQICHSAHGCVTS